MNRENTSASPVKFNTMNVYRQYIAYGAILLATVVGLGSCEDDYQSDAADPGLPLTVDGASIKAPGHGQYKVTRKLVDGQVVITADFSTLNGVKSLTVTKTVATQKDETFGQNGVVTIDPLGQAKYDYTYNLQDGDVDKLIGLTFQAQDQSGNVLTSDVTLVVTLSPRENIPRKKWAWTSRLWVDNDNSQDLKDCEKDNYYLFNSDSTVTVNYGADTGAGDCAFDGFTIYDKWYLTADEKYFILKSHGLFDPTVKVDSFQMQTLTVDKLEMSIDIDLSIFGLGTDETFLYQYTAEPK
ncbi:hypothetical protein SAMN04488109_4833 [Chryseolinea serpens]|uniref:Uncharacterized protein n=1 Tax=Chryseolinea serpens TaxID=947013 RepID=A0A1M5UQB3_9BACT|nr:hypothetical protein [Chryseolinea serpens]SHH65110.1 hypothetical protein SAMN04488109_4833 [Chryseolinea serpens]